jgi:hypothetical protein
MSNTIKISGNDACGLGEITVTHTNSSHAVSPLNFEFKGLNGTSYSFSLHTHSIRQLAVFLVEKL